MPDDDMRASSAPEPDHDTGADDRAFVRAMYQVILGREPDPDGLEAHTRDLQASDPGTRYAGKLRQFLDSAEGTEQTLNRLSVQDQIRRYGGAGDATWVGLGSHCATSNMLKLWGLRDRSLPFDWLFSNLAMVSHCLDDDFADFLRPDYLEPVDVGDDGHPRRICEHRLFRDRYGVHRCFNHHNPRESEKDRHYFERCIARLRHILQSRDSKRFVCIRPEGDGQDDFDRVRLSLQRRSWDLQLMLVSVAEPDAGAPLPRIERIAAPDGALHLRFLPLSPFGELSFRDPLDNVSLLKFLKAEAAAM